MRITGLMAGAGLTVGMLVTAGHGFVAGDPMLERIGGIMVYEATNPAAPRFVTYVNTRDLSVDPEALEPGENAGDLGPEPPGSCPPIRARTAGRCSSCRTR